MSWAGNKISTFCNHVFYMSMWFLFFSYANSFAATLDDGNNFLKKGQLNEAIQSYETLVKEGYIGHELFFNLGTAYAKKGNASQAVFNFEKALRLKPMDELTRQQLIQLNLKLQDKPSIYEDTGLLAFIKKVQFALSIDAWAFLSILFMLMLALAIFISYKFQQLKSRKFIFLSSIVWFLLSGFSVLMARNSYHFKYLQLEGVVHSESIKVFDQPDPNSVIQFNLHQGTKVEIDDSTANMYHIRYAEKKGWIVNKDVQKIEL
jgi:tetratricopeptide (TPR) repeat protein